MSNSIYLSSKLYSASLITLCILIGILPAHAQLNNFVDESKNLFGSPDPNSRFVVLNSGIAGMAAQQFGLPKNAMTYPIAGMTIFPYYQASAPLKEFLNNAMVFGMPVTQFPATPVNPQISLPPTDLVRRSIPIPQGPFEKKKAGKLTVVDKRVKDEVPWMVAHEGGQAFQIPGDSEALALVAPGSMFSACAARTMVLRCGVMWIFTGARPAAVLTKNAAIVVRPFSIAAVEASWYNSLRVASLNGQPVEMQLAFDGKSDKLVLEKGKELSLKELATNHVVLSPSSSSGMEKPADLSLISEKEDGSGQTPVPSKVPGLHVVSSFIDPKKCNLLGELASVNLPFANARMGTDFDKMFSSFGVSPAMRRAEMKKQLLEKYNIATKAAVNKLGQYPAAATEAAKEPKAATQSDQELRTIRLNKGFARTFSSSDLALEKNGNPKLNQGEALFCAREAMVIQSNTFSVHLRAGASVLMLARPDLILVRNLGEKEANSVKIRLGNHIYDCGVGAELVAGTSAPAIYDEMRNDGIERRNMQSTENGKSGFIVNKCELSLTSLLKYSPLMHTLYKSRDDADKKLVSDLMKTIVALNMVTGTHGNYRRINATKSAMR